MRPCGTGLADCQFWCDDPNVTLEEAFAGPVYVDGSCDTSVHLAYHAAGWAVVSMRDGKPFDILSGQVGDLYTQCSGVAEMLAVIAACTISPLVTEVHTDYKAAIDLFQNPGYPRKNQHSGFKVLAGKAVVPPSTRLEKVKAHQD